MRENRQEYPCQTINMSAGGIAVRAPDVGERGERIVMYVDTLGRIEGEIVRTSKDGFALKLHATRHRQEKIVSTLTWLLNKDRFVSLEARRHDRNEPKNQATKLRLPDGSELSCRVLDISLSGAAVAADVAVPTGALVMLGRTPGQVIRQNEGSVSIEFVEIQEPAALKRQFG
ncbi:MAG: PilZ domain-containing protein [Hyphomicrobiaceae bacterium]|nr:PilZ domain-containing protein [Hyphomicrobiaceae bacterium]